MISPCLPCLEGHGCPGSQPFLCPGLPHPHLRSCQSFPDTRSRLHLCFGPNHTQCHVLVCHTYPWGQETCYPLSLRVRLCLTFPWGQEAWCPQSLRVCLCLGASVFHLYSEQLLTQRISRSFELCLTSGKGSAR